MTKVKCDQNCTNNLNGVCCLDEIILETDDDYGGEFCQSVVEPPRPPMTEAQEEAALQRMKDMIDNPPNKLVLFVNPTTREVTEKRKS